MFLHALFHVFQQEAFFQKLFQIISFSILFLEFFLSVSFWLGYYSGGAVISKKHIDILEASFNSLWYLRESEVFCLEIAWYRKLAPPLPPFSPCFFTCFRYQSFCLHVLCFTLLSACLNCWPSPSFFSPNFLIIFASALGFCDINSCVNSHQRSLLPSACLIFSSYPTLSLSLSPSFLQHVMLPSLSLGQYAQLPLWFQWSWSLSFLFSFCFSKASHWSKCTFNYWLQHKEYQAPHVSLQDCYICDTELVCALLCKYFWLCRLLLSWAYSWKLSTKRVDHLMPVKIYNVELFI